jgi:hypothetical protein
MTESPPSPLSRWRYGMHPHAAEMRIRSIGRVELPLGEALRLEMASADPGQEDIAHLQYYIATELGPWALWLSCAHDEVADCEASLQELMPPFEEEQEAKPRNGWHFGTRRHGGSSESARS